MAVGFLLVYLRHFNPDERPWLVGLAAGSQFELRVAHAHGGLFSLINIAIGLVLGRAAVSEAYANATSWLAIAGFLMPIGILGEVFLGLAPVLVIIGGACVLIASLMAAWASLSVGRRPPG
jgi:hypothetical protein